MLSIVTNRAEYVCKHHGRAQEFLYERGGGEAQKDPSEGQKKPHIEKKTPIRRKKSEKAPHGKKYPSTRQKSSKKVPHIAIFIIFFRSWASDYACPTHLCGN